MLRRRSNTQNISWFFDQISFGRLNLDPPYQRNSVWTPDYKKFFIDTILNNYPCPTIFLNLETRPDGATIYHVVDGKQRLSTVLSYLKEEFKTSRSSDPAIADKYFSDLSDEQKTAFFEYTFTVENISGAATEILTEAFDRLNRNVSKLTDQELRHAKYSGKFINMMESLAGESLWKEIGIASAGNIRRMKDIEFVSEIFLLTMNGITDGKADVIDYFYAEYDETIPYEEENRIKYETVKVILNKLDLPLRQTRLSNLADFYSLWAALLVYIDKVDQIDYENTRKSLLSFVEDINFAHQSSENASQKAFSYLISARQGSNKAANREIRAKILEELIILL